MGADEFRPPLLHPLIRILIFVIVSGFLMIQFMVMLIFGAYITGLDLKHLLEDGGSAVMLVATCISYAPVIVSLWLCRWLFDRASVNSLGIGLRSSEGWSRHLGGGLIAGALAGVISPLVAIGLHTGEIERISVQALSITAFYLVAFGFQSAMEELIIRGYLLQNLLTRYSICISIGVTSVVFALLHIANFMQMPHLTIGIAILGLVNIALFGVVTSLLYLRMGDLWAAIGLHWGWNFSISHIMGVPVSGVPIEHRWLLTKWYDSPWLTGGGFGPEGSVVTTALLLAGIAWLIATTDFAELPVSWWQLVRGNISEQAPKNAHSDIIENEVTEP